MGLISKKLLGVKITTSSGEIILEEIRKYLIKSEKRKAKSEKQEIKPLIIFTPNPEIINYTQIDSKFKEIVNSAQINIPDGAGVVWAMKKIYGNDISKVSGIDLMLDFSRMSAENAFRIGLIGGRGNVALKTAECLRRSYNNLQVEVFPEPEVRIPACADRQNSEFRIQNYSSKLKINSKEANGRYFYNLVNEIIKKKIDILFVALGCPKQEYFIERVKLKAKSEKLDRPLVMMAVGGSFDYISGRVRRAPLWVRESGLEWLYRLIREPWRWRRQIEGAEFFWRVLFNSS